MKSLAIVGTVGLPANYGGFETLVENLVKYNYTRNDGAKITVWCSAKEIRSSDDKFLDADLKYINLSANGVQSIPYDIISIISAILMRKDVILLLGVSGAIILPIARIFSQSRIIVNIDGMEWKRDKWGFFAKKFLKISEWAAVKFSHEVIADNQAIADHVNNNYNKKCHVIAYGGDHAISEDGDSSNHAVNLPKKYCLSLCRIEPENNVHLILDAFSKSKENLVFIGNWSKSQYGKSLKETYSSNENLILLDPIYDIAKLKTIRKNSSLYIHGHSAGGTNPSLVEMMHFGIPIVAYDCVYNRYTTEDCAMYFSNSDDLIGELQCHEVDELNAIGSAMKDIALRRYTWKEIGKSYFDIIER